ncbi:hypothetical protein FRC01_009853 [Tulasnella sp. 417]|nr:hypothetical protein FRC01_009853 [Tulasnella sp. 417]
MNSFTSSLNQRLHLDIDRASGVFGSLVRSQTFLSGSNLASTPGTENVFFGRDDEEYAGEDEGGVPEEDEMEEIEDEHPSIAHRDAEWDAEERDRLLHAHAHQDEEFVVGSTNWDEDDADTPTSTLGPTTMPFASRPRTHSRPMAGSYRQQQQSRTRHISTPTIPSSSVRSGRGRTSSGASRSEARRSGSGATPPATGSSGATPSRMSPPMAAVIEGRPSSAPVAAPRFMPSSPTQVRQVDDERTPLIRISGASSPTRYDSVPVTPTTEATLAPSPTSRYLQPRPKVVIPQQPPPPPPPHRNRERRRSSAVKRSRLPPGRSTYGQTLFNSIAILLGIGMLSCPLAFACAGWIGGTLLVIFYGFLTCYTAKALAKIILSDGRLRTYADIGQAAFGPRSNMFTSFLFCLELFAVSVILVVLFSDSLHEVLPAYSSNTYKYFGLLVIIPTSFMPLRVLSFASILGAVATCIYGLIGAAGYRMFGHGVSPEVSQNLLRTPGFSQFLNKVALWMLVMSPLSKFSLSARPMCVTIEILLGIEESSPVPSHNKPRQLHAEDHHQPQQQPQQHHGGAGATDTETDAKDAYYSHGAITTDDENPHNAYISSNRATRAQIERRKAFWRFVERSLLAVVVVLVAIFIPDFTTSMAFLGAFSAFALCVIGPLAAKMSIERRVTWYDCLMIVIATVMATWATYIAIATA